MTVELELPPARKLTRDLKKAAGTLSKDKIRYLVDRYYQVQADRIRAEHQAGIAEESGEPNELLNWNAEQARSFENSIKSVLNSYSLSRDPGVWLQSVYGLGPVISAGLLAHIDIEKAPTVGHIWRFAGLDPTLKWEKGERRPWNANLKVLCWKAGESFVKFHGQEECIYGQLYAKRKILESSRNDEGQFREQAEKSLAEKNWRDDTQAKKWYLQGKLPPARIHARARRYAVKLFLAHLHHVMYEDHFKTAPPKPYAFAILGHDDREYVGPQGWPLSRG